MKVLILGANGMLGPWVSKALSDHEIIETDLEKIPSNINYHKIDISNTKDVLKISEGVDAIINLSVLRADRKLAFDVNTLGNYNMMLAAETHKISRIINTGPHFQIAGPTYEDFDFELNPDMPPQPGVNLYALSKSLGQEICNQFTRKNDFIFLQTLLFYIFYDENYIRAAENTPQPSGSDPAPFSVTWTDAAEAIKLALEIDLKNLPSRSESYFINSNLPHNKFSNQKAKNILGWNATKDFEELWNRKNK
ncbi:MAG: NAD(P)-dependent oxidoreductase [Dehalococcoidia bacterium]|jgi:nucleoside-diphosphate-sugar epimerase|nr:NAD(P)-dependent oxidoreductase [Dehalococcoidia bacterium]